MPRARLAGLVPFAALAALVAAASVAAVFTSVPGAGPGIATPPIPTVATRALGAGTPLMAYWRDAAGGGADLWVAEIEGGRRWTVADRDKASDVALTRWSPVGDAVAYVVGGRTLAVTRLDGASIQLDIPQELRRSFWRIVSYEWSPDGRRISASLRAANGLSDESDVYLIEPRGGAQWERLTTFGDAFAGTWIDADRLFVEEASGAIVVLDLRDRSMRPLSAIRATSPRIGPDGRVWFVGGLAVMQDLPSPPFASGWVWSAALSGDDLRRETATSRGQLRLYGLLADGRPVVGLPGAIYVWGDAEVALRSNAGTIRRAIVAPDGRRIFLTTDQRILVLDAAKVPRSGTLPTDAATVFLSGTRDTDLWYPPSPPTLVTGAPSASFDATLAFVLGNTVWRYDAGGGVRAALVDPARPLPETLRWSPQGNALAVMSAAPSGSEVSTLTVLGDGGTRRLRVPIRYPAGLSWSADGRSIAVPVMTAPDEWRTLVFDAATGRETTQLAGRVTFAGGTAFALSDGAPPPAQTLRVGQRLEMGVGRQARVVTDASRLLASPLLRDLPASASGAPLIARAEPSPDAEYVALWMYLARNNGLDDGALVVVRTSSGEPVWRTPISPLSAPDDVAWSPQGHLLAWSEYSSTRSAVAVDPVRGKTLIGVEGRFAGWGRDGRSVYVARDDGLFAHPVDGTARRRVGPLGVSVALAP